MEIIKARITFFYNNNVRKEYTTFPTIVEKIPSSETINLTWDNLLEIYEKYNFALPFFISTTKKGKIINFTDGDSIFIEKIKEIKTTNLNMSIQLDYIPANASINDILNYHDSDLAIKYLIEKGLTIIHN